jgi:dTDP-4-amino-4,6-dideoxygalactose transaminase
MRRIARHELAVYSPLSITHLASALLRGWSRGTARAARALLAREFEAEHVVLTDSGRSALQLAIASAMRGAGRRAVALPAFQCYEVATAAVGAGHPVALYDVDPSTLQPDLASIERALRAGAAVVVVAPLYGYPVDWEEIAALASRHGAVAIEDAAQGHGAEWKGRWLGTMGDLAVVSFGRGKGWTGAGGGALLVRSQRVRGELPPLAASSAAHEIRVALSAGLQLALGRAWLYGVPASIPALRLGETHYHDPVPPREATKFSAALIARTFDASVGEVARRRANAAQWLLDLPAGLASCVPAVLAGGTGGFLRLPLRVARWRGHDRAPAAARRLGIARSYPRTLAELPALAPLLIDPRSRFPGAETLSRELVTLPTHSGVAAAARRDVVGLLRDVASG